MNTSLNDGSARTIYHVDVSLVLKTFYLGTATAIIFAYKIPTLKDRFLAYGARNTVTQTPSDVQPSDVNSSGIPPHSTSADGLSQLNPLLDFLGSLQVPHSWFFSFYCISLASSAVWGFQLSKRGTLYHMIADPASSQHASMSLDQVALCWLLLACQGTRRLWECATLTKASRSRMWVFHWLAGVLFYISVGISVWIEGIPALESSEHIFDNVRFTASSWRVLIFLPIFLLASILQNRVHAYLASLRKYTLPSHWAFSKIICPHYTAECVVYLALTVLAAPQGYLVNGTMLCAVVFVIVNLGVTADISQTWFMEKFGKEKVQGKWRMLPGLW